MSATVTDIQELLQPTEPTEGETCHSIDTHTDWAYCGAFKSDGRRLHSNKDCKARGHKHCQVCYELVRQLGDDWMVA